MSVGRTVKDPGPEAGEAKELERERYELLQRLEDWLEIPMLVLAFVWLALLIAELIWGESLWFEIIGTTIWIIFLLILRCNSSSPPTGLHTSSGTG